MSKRTRGDLQLILPKDGSPSVHLPREDSSKVTITKTVDLHIEDFLGKLNEAVQNQRVDEDFVTSPRFIIGDQKVFFVCWIDEEEDNSVNLDVVSEDGSDYLIRSMLVTGNCGNLTLEKRHGDEYRRKFLSVELGSVEELKEAMTNSGNHKLDLQVAITVPGNNDDNGQWIISRYVFRPINCLRETYEFHLSPGRSRDSLTSLW